MDKFSDLLKNSNDELKTKLSNEKKHLMRFQKSSGQLEKTAR